MYVLTYKRLAKQPQGLSQASLYIPRYVGHFRIIGYFICKKNRHLKLIARNRIGCICAARDERKVKAFHFVLSIK